MGIALQVFVNLSKLLESQGARACDAECIKWMVELLKHHKPSLLNVSDPGNAHTMAASIVALDLAAGNLPDDGIGRRRRREINGALAQAICLVDEKHMATGLSDGEIKLIKQAKLRLGSGMVGDAGAAKLVDTHPDTEEDHAPKVAGSPWGASGAVRVRDIDAVRDLRVGQGMNDTDLVRLPLPGREDIRTENLDSSVQAIISENSPENGVDWVGLALVGLALVIPPMGLFMSGAAWAMEHKGRSMVLAALAVAGSFAWLMAT